MENELDQLYAALAEKIISMVPVNWNKIYYLGEVAKERESWSSVFYFEESDTLKMIKSNHITDEYGVSETTYYELLRELSSTMLDIYACFEKNEQPLWEQLHLNLTRDGAINIEFKYDVQSEESGSHLRREIVWAYEVVGIVPKEGTYLKKVLDDYLEKK
ncbi:immunity protein YezG family protein [Carnobacterium gallinarum]|uniref:immunity protein YezG family protein n=1 Tax=Carnobacterium gallinarum TaxID=2749 RepID=UPI00054E7A52|nr:immunity protein YezG family protein [Carnobacterium gallinarum]